MSDKGKSYLHRLRREYSDILQKPVENIVAHPLPSNILEWHYAIKGPSDSPYAGGVYHGKVKFTQDYPFKPPSIYMITPNGRFETNKRLCLSMSDYHPESWNPMWSVSSILTGLLSFMLDNQATLGSISTSDDAKRRYAMKSMEFNTKDKAFVELFSDLVEEYEKDVKEGKINLNEQTAKPNDVGLDSNQGVLMPACAFLSVIIGVMGVYLAL